MSSFFRFPHTPHLAWLGEGKPRDDKVLGAEELRELLLNDVVVEEKLDGANLGLSVDDDGALRAQNRGSYLDVDAPQGQWKPLKRWLSERRYSLVDALGPELILFGEWCYAVHSVRYDSLPDWFLAFDVYDREKSEFWSTERRDSLALELALATVPRRGSGHFDVAGLRRLLDRSAYTGARAEGLYVRRESEGRLVSRAKLVNAEFTQAIDEHWSKRPIEANQLAVR